MLGARVCRWRQLVSPVMRGLDPRIHLPCKKVFAKIDGLPGHKRVYARLQRAMPGNDNLRLAPSGFAGRYPLASPLSNTRANGGPPPSSSARPPAPFAAA